MPSTPSHTLDGFSNSELLFLHTPRAICSFHALAPAVLVNIPPEHPHVYQAHLGLPFRAQLQHPSSWKPSWTDPHWIRCLTSALKTSEQSLRLPPLIYYNDFVPTYLGRLQFIRLWISILGATCTTNVCGCGRVGVCVNENTCVSVAAALETGRDHCKEKKLSPLHIGENC